MKRDAAGRRIVVMLMGIAIMGFGVSLFKLSFMGNDPHTAMVIAIGDRVGVDFSVILLFINCFWFLLEWKFGKEMIGIGTFVNWFFVGTIASVCEKAILSVWNIPSAIGARLFLMAAGVLTLSLACAMYQSADVGVAPYDALSIMISRRSGRSYFSCRIFTDSLCVAVAFAAGGLLGTGTLICAVGLGPFIAFFEKNVVNRMVIPEKI